MPVSITVYESKWCGFCRAARRLLEKKGWEYTSLMVDSDANLRVEMVSRSGRSSVPQIFFGDTHVGGFDDLAELDADGKLEALRDSDH